MLHRSSLRLTLGAAGVRRLCVIKSNLSGIQNGELTIRPKDKKMFFLKGKKFYLCTFDVKVIIAPADIRFELWFRGKKFSKNHEPVQIDWDMGEG